jgi:hypothetical protein
MKKYNKKKPGKLIQQKLTMRFVEFMATFYQRKEKGLFDSSMKISAALTTNSAPMIRWKKQRKCMKTLK